MVHQRTPLPLRHVVGQQKHHPGQVVDPSVPGWQQGQGHPVLFRLGHRVEQARVAGTRFGHQVGDP